MSPPVYRVCNLLEKTLAGVPIGTNLGLFQLQFALVSGRFLESRGAVFPALNDLGLAPHAVRRASAALRKGRWKTQDLLDNWQEIVQAQGHFRAHCYAGFQPVACDLTGFRRPGLQGNRAKHYVAQAGKALPSIVVGMAALVGTVGSSRLALPRLLVRWEPTDTREAQVQTRLVEQAGKSLAPEELAVFDAGFSLAEVRALTPRFVVRLAKNATMRRNVVPAYQGHGRPALYGEVIRPLARSHGGKHIAASAPDAHFSWQEGDVCLEAQVWNDVVLPKEKPGAVGVNVVAIFDPRYQEPLLLASNLEVCASVVRCLYRDRWAVEHLPLAGKPMLGCGQGFVFGALSRFRLPELALLCGNILSYAAATCSAVATGFWDRASRATCGRLRRVLGRLDFCELPALGEQLRKKASVTGHLATGAAGHRRQKGVRGPEAALQPT